MYHPLHNSSRRRSAATPARPTGGLRCQLIHRSKRDSVASDAGADGRDQSPGVFDMLKRALVGSSTRQERRARRRTPATGSPCCAAEVTVDGPRRCLATDPRSERQAATIKTRMPQYCGARRRGVVDRTYVIGAWSERELIRRAATTPASSGRPR